MVADPVGNAHSRILGLEQRGRRPDRFYDHRGSLETLREIDTGAVPECRLISSDGAELVMPVEHGRVLEFSTLLGRRHRWALFATQDELLLERPGSVLNLTRGQAHLSCFRVGPLCRLTIDHADGRRRERFWVRIPLLDMIFHDPVVEMEMEKDVCFYFAQCQQPEELRNWAYRWSRGIGVRSTAYPAAYPPDAQSATPAL